jgi:hypothetical protein
MNGLPPSKAEIIIASITVLFMLPLILILLLVIAAHVVSFFSVFF